MAKIRKESLEVFQSVLDTVDDSWQTEFNLRETVRQSFELIKKARKYKVSWEKIAEILKQSSGVEEISPKSLRQYYFEFSKNPKLLPKKKRKPTRASEKSSQAENPPPQSEAHSPQSVTVDTNKSQSSNHSNSTEAQSEKDLSQPEATSRKTNDYSKADIMQDFYL